MTNVNPAPPPLVFGDRRAKKEAEAFYRRAKRRSELVEIGVGYFLRWVPRKDWPKVTTPNCAFPKPFQRHPRAVLEAIAADLQSRPNPA